MCAMSQFPCHTSSHSYCLTRAIVSQLDQRALGSQYRGMSWNVFVTRPIPSMALICFARTTWISSCMTKKLPCPRNELLSQLRSCDGVIVRGGERVDAEFLDAAPKLKVVSCVAVGYDNVDLAEATRHRVAITNTPDVLNDAVADLTWALLLGVARRVVEGDRSRAVPVNGRAWHPCSCWALMWRARPSASSGPVASAQRWRGEAPVFQCVSCILRATTSPRWMRLAPKRVTFDEVLSRVRFSVRPRSPDARHAAYVRRGAVSQDETDRVFHQHGAWRCGR